MDSIFSKEIYDPEISEFTVSRKKEKRKLAGSKIYVFEKWLPKSAVHKKGDLLVSSPELVFLQLTTRVNIHQLILLGLQLCSHPPGNSTAAITSKTKILNFLNMVNGYKGYKKALRAARYIEDGSGSIMESLVFMILTLPNILGGYGLRGGILNYEIALSDNAAKQLRQRRCYADIYFKSKRVAVEYDSFTHHSSPQEQGRDFLRADLLRRHGVEVMHMSTIQLYNENACDVFARNLAKRLGKRIYIRTDKYKKMRNHLRELLPAERK